ncbi:hypothetical protein CAC42_4450 [Sphaceloma murrayae]|uniref:Uncharacterized protein n=1 Tax=Sphaceloma murrayae TaxID=2082308 RepID=A0A2K1QME2_9PEZI|nr:hypothetical protein CAC42_4450 [Sphaceloma murrayae]
MSINIVDTEKSPLLPTTTSPTTDATLTHLRSEVDRTRSEHIHANAQYAAAWRHTRQGRTITIIHNIILTIVGLISFAVISAMLVALGYAIIYGDDDPAFRPARRIPLEAHIMSKCPDARDCLRDLVLPAMQRVEKEVDFRLSFIGTAEEEGDGVACMHGPEECLGNILELCAARLYPDPKINLGFTMCMTRQFADIPDKGLVQDCALEHGISFEKLNDCAGDEHGGRGMKLLRRSVEWSSRANVTTSCTVRLDGKEWCVRDGGEWKNCDGGSNVADLVGEVRRLREVDVS